MSNKYKYKDEDIREAVRKSRSFAETQKNLGAGKSGSVYMHLKKRILEMEIDTSHFNPYWSASLNSVRNNNKTPVEEVLVINESKLREKSHRLRSAMIEYGIEYACSHCNISAWNEKPITLHCEHINGKNYDNRPENLCFLCPNCHSQTDTYGFRGKSQLNLPDPEEI